MKMRTLVMLDASLPTMVEGENVMVMGMIVILLHDHFIYLCVFSLFGVVMQREGRNYILPIYLLIMWWTCKRLL
jgi:hypothetical protein